MVVMVEPSVVTTPVRAEVVMAEEVLLPPAPPAPPAPLPDSVAVEEAAEPVMEPEPDAPLRASEMVVS